MLKWKSQLTCSYCSKIYKDPILLTCEDSICREHLSERDVVRENKIKCKLCSEEFGVKDNEFKSIKPFTNLIETQSYLSDEETSLKRDLDESLRKFFDYYDEFAKNKTQLESDVFEHFQEIRFQIDEHRERLKVKIDDIALAMTEKIKKHEEAYLKELKKSFSSFDDSQYLQIKLNELEETFRNPNLLIKTIKEMQQKQEESLKEIQLKLNEMTIVKVNSEATNEFKPNVSLFNQKEEDTSLFGSIKLNQYSNMNSLKSEILKGEHQMSKLLNLCEFSPRDKWSLLYRGTRDSFRSNEFHYRCDGHSDTLTIFKAKQTSFIFDGFTTVSWDSSNTEKSDPYAFIFSLTNNENKPMKIKIHPNCHHHAIRCFSSYGPTFGDDIFIDNNANTTWDSFSNFGACYKHPQYGHGTNEGKTFLAGSYKFQLDEIEVYEKEWD
jgi:hypothetical protein